MIISVERAKTLIQFPDLWTDERIKMKLLAIEQTIRAYTNNNFQDRGRRVLADISGGVFASESLAPFTVGDTVQVSEAHRNNGLYTVAEVSDNTFIVHELVDDEPDVLVTKIAYPPDVVDCCVNLLEWEIRGREKIGIKSETLSRHSVTYEDSAALFMGYPLGILNGLKLYKKARF